MLYDTVIHYTYRTATTYSASLRHTVTIFGIGITIIVITFVGKLSLIASGNLSTIKSPKLPMRNGHACRVTVRYRNPT